MSIDPVTQDSLIATLLNGHKREELTAQVGTAPALLEQYKLYVEMADRISARRLTANSFFLTLNSAVIALGGYATLRFNEQLPTALALASALSGISLCLLWQRLVRSYRDLNSAKFKVIHEIEKLLPISPYDAEWQAVGRGIDPDKYLPISHLETFVPWVFVALHLGAFVIPLF